MDQITVVLTNPDAVLFKQWQEFHGMFTLLVEKGVFDVKFGQVTLNFADGELKTIEKKEIVYHK